MPSEKTSFLLRNLLKGFLWFVIIILVIILVKRLLPVDWISRLSFFWEHSVVVYAVFFISEIVFGIIPPEIFMVWALQGHSIPGYILYVASFMFISYLAGIAGFCFGSFLNQTRLYSLLVRGYFRKYEKLVADFGTYMIIVAATTPVPYSAICMMVGAGKYPFRKFLVFALFRILRFAVYGYFVWEADLVLQFTG